MEEEAEGTLICGILLLPSNILTPPAQVPPCIYSTDQLAAIQQGRALVPGLQNIERVPPIRALAAGIPPQIAEGVILPKATVITASDATTWQAATPYTLTQAEIIPFIDPSRDPTLSNAWGITAKVFYGRRTARGLFNPNDYNPPEIVPGGNLLYFPKTGMFIRRNLVVMADYAGVSGGYYYPLTSELYPAFSFLYVDQDSYPHDHYFNAPKTSYTSIEVSRDGLNFFDQYNFFDPFCRDALSSGSLVIAKHQNLGFTTEISDYGHTAITYSEGLGHWSTNKPAIILPGRKSIGIAPIIGILLLLGLGGVVSAPPPSRRRRREKLS